METMRQDFRFAVRQLVARPTFTIAALLLLGLGLGANATIFGLMEALLFRPLPGVAQPEQLVEIANRGISYPAYRDLRDDSRFAIDLAGFRTRRMTLSGEGRNTLVTTGVASANYFSVLRVAPVAGRVFGPADGVRGAEPVAVLGYRFWQRTFGGDPAIVGRTVKLNDRTVSVVGIAGKEFRGTWLTSAPDLWVPMSAWPLLAPSSFARIDLESRGWDWITAFGRLAPDVTPARAAGVLNVSLQRLQKTYPREMEDVGPIVLKSSVASALGDAPRDAVVRFMAVLMSVVGLVLLLVCANVANLLLARAAGRRREFGVRIALGASRGRLMRQLLTESLVLSGAAAIVGFGVLSIDSGLLSGVSVGDLSFAGLALDPDRRVLGFMALLAFASALLFGVIPARQTLATDLTPALRDGAAGAGSPRSFLRGTLLTAQVALSLVLLIGAGLFTRALQRAIRIDPGFAVDHVATAAVDPGLSHYDGARAGQYVVAANAQLTGLPGVASFAWGSSLPMSSDEDQESADILGYVSPTGRFPSVEMAFVSRDYFRTLRIPLRAGREFDARDLPERPRVAVINETMAQRFWPGRDAIGQRFVMLNDTTTVVGIAHDVAYHALGETPRPYVYLCGDQQLGKSFGTLILLARTTGDPGAAGGAIRTALLAADPHVTPFALGRLDDQLRELLLPQRAGAAVLGAFSLLALFVALVGVHGVVSYAVSRRTREIGIRVALGARGERVVGELVRQHLPYIAAGVVIGLALAAAGTRALASFLYGISTTDFPTFAGAAVALAAVAIVAAALPARRAARVDPMIALRSE